MCRFCLTIILQSCSNENLITTPTENKGEMKSMAKTITLPMTYIDHAKDTIITLGKGKNTIEVRKGLSTDKITLLDKYLSSHKMYDKSQTVIPLTQGGCDTYYQTDCWGWFEDYQSIPGKYLGISINSNVGMAKIHDQYGFTNILVPFYNTTDAFTAHFNHDSIMINLPLNVSQSMIDDNGNQAYKSYYIDEPFKNLISNQYFLSIASWIYTKSSTAKFVFSDYYWPPSNLLKDICCPNGHLSTIETYWFPDPNVYIMCDQYEGNCCGNVHDFWNEYKADYGIPSRNISNWISINPGFSQDWGDLLNLATAWGFNPIWIYAGDQSIGENDVQSFCADAWATGWLLRSGAPFTIVWKCTNPSPCENCEFPTYGNWYVYDVYYTASAQFYHY